MSKVLIVDDDEMLAEIICEILVEANQAAVTATNASAALRILKEDPHVTTLLADYRLRDGRSGLELLRAAADLDQNLRCILMSGNTHAITEDLGDFEVLEKPLRMNGLLAILSSTD